MSTCKFQGFPGINIIGGEDATEGEFPYHIGIYGQIRFNGTLYNGSYCGGALLVENNKQFVLTSATCVGVYVVPQPDLYRLVAGDLSKVSHSGNEQFRNPNRIWDGSSSWMGLHHKSQ